MSAALWIGDGEPVGRLLWNRTKKIVSSFSHLIGKEHHDESAPYPSPPCTERFLPMDAPATGQALQAGRPSAEAEEEGLAALLGEGTRGEDED